MKEKEKGYEFCKIEDIIKKVKTGKWVLPIWQRDYVWKKINIINLFDSIYRQYPIGNILIWKTKFRDNAFCSFKNEADFRGEMNLTEPSNVINKKNKNDINAVLDGQQRVTSLYLSLSNDKDVCINSKGKDGSNDKKLYVMFNLLSDIKKMKEPENIFDIDDCESWEYVLKKDGRKDGLFMRLDHILDADFKKYFNDLQVDVRPNKDENNKALNNIRLLRKIFFNTKICVRTIDNDVREAFELFHRLNSQGLVLSPTQLSTCRLIYLDDTIKSKINKDLQEINKKDFEFDVSYIVNLLYLMANNGVIKDNKKDIKEEIVKYYDKAIRYTKKVCKVLLNVGLGKKIITSYNAILPITYYFYKNKKDKVNDNEKNAIKYFMLLSMIKGLFGGSSRDTINKAVKEIKNKQLTISNIKKIEIKKNIDNNFYVNQKIINDWLNKFKKGDKTTRLLLYILYPNYKRPEYGHLDEDHMHPVNNFRKEKNKIFAKLNKNKQVEWQKNKDLIPNLQLLLGNKEKSDKTYKEWSDKILDYKTKDDYFPKNIKDNDGNKIDITEFKNFDYFFEERKKLMCKKLCNILGVKYKKD